VQGGHEPIAKLEVYFKGFGTKICPPIWVGIEEAPSMEAAFIVAVIDVYKGRQLLVTRGGYIAVEAGDKLEALEMINEILATLFLTGTTVYPAREWDLGEAEIKGDYKRFEYGVRCVEAKPITRLTEDKIKAVIRYAEKITSNDKLKTLIMLYHEAYTHFIAYEYRQSLLFCWIILEDFYINDMFQHLIAKTVKSQERLKKLMRWTADQKIEVLSIVRAVSDDEYQQLMELKEYRNKLVHEGIAPSKDIVKLCLDIAFKVVDQHIKNV
jgi:hypothetical protein